jgi:hypothetical protein
MNHFPAKEKEFHDIPSVFVAGQSLVIHLLMGKTMTL